METQIPATVIMIYGRGDLSSQMRVIPSHAVPLWRMHYLPLGNIQSQPKMTLYWYLCNQRCMSPLSCTGTFLYCIVWFYNYKVYDLNKKKKRIVKFGWSLLNRSYVFDPCMPAWPYRLFLKVYTVWYSLLSMCTQQSLFRPKVCTIIRTKGLPTLYNIRMEITMCGRSRTQQ